MLIHEDTIVALATPPGTGALGLIRVAGPDAFRIVDDIFRGADLAAAATHTIHFGHIQDESQHVLDEVLTLVYRAPRTYTGDDIIEISCHGSAYILQSIIELIIRKGARAAKPGEFTLRAFLNGKMDLSQAEAVADLIASDSESAHALAMQQMRGGISDEIKKLRQELIDFAALIELELDFGEEDVEFANRDDLQQLIRKIQVFIQQLLESFRLGNAIKEGVSTVIAGRPNAGKSTLLNALLNEERAIVTEIPGTTRDTIEEILNIRGVPFRLIDTAGIREAHDQVEAIGVEKTLATIRKSRVLIYVFDITELTPDEVKTDLDKIYQPDLSIIAVANKMDLNPYADPTLYHFEKYPHYRLITTSALNRMNIEALKEILYDTVIDQDIYQGNPIVSNVRHVASLQSANESMDAVLQGLDSGVTPDFVAMDIRQALYHLGEITGEIHTDDLLDSIFSRFCIGK